MTARGVTLPEALVAALLGVGVLGLALRSLVVLQRAVRGEQARAAVRGTLLDAVHALRVELSDVDPAAGDLVVAEPARLVYRGVRATGIACRAVAGSLVVERSSFRALRGPAPGRDSALMLSPDQPDGWARAAVTSGPRPSACPGGQAGVAMAVSRPPARAGAFARLFETVEIRFYQSGGEWWLGYRSASAGETAQPVAGPFAPASFGFEYLDAAGAVTRGSGAVRTLRFHGVVSQRHPPVRDSLRVAIAFAGAGWP